MEEIHLTKKDFKLEWFSGTGKGGQNRNKVQVCCRITHLESGISTVGQNSRSRVDNQRDAFERLASKLLVYYNGDGQKERRTTSEVVRNYHAVRNEVHDKASGLKLTYKEVVENGNIEPMIEARHNAKSTG